jgi:hypothetical protein
MARIPPRQREGLGRGGDEVFPKKMKKNCGLKLTKKIKKIKKERENFFGT